MQSAIGRKKLSIDDALRRDQVGEDVVESRFVSDFNHLLEHLNSQIAEVLGQIEQTSEAD